MTFYDLEMVKAEVDKKVFGIVFFISRYGKYKHRMHFKPEITLMEAIIQAEKWLDRPVTQEYFDKIKDDLFCEELESYGYRDETVCRRDLLGDMRFVEGVVVKDNIARLIFGS